MRTSSATLRSAHARLKCCGKCLQALRLSSPSRARYARLGAALVRWGARYARCFPALSRAWWLALRGWGPLASVPAPALSLPLCAAAGRSARFLVDSPVPQAAGGSLAPRVPLLRRRFPRPTGVGCFVAWVRSPCLPIGRQGERLRTKVRAFFVGYRFGIRSGSLRPSVGVVAAAPRRCVVGFCLSWAAARWCYFCWCFPLRPVGRTPLLAVLRSRVPARSLMARGVPRPLLRFGCSLRSHRPSAWAASAQRCRASRGLFFGYRRLAPLAGCRYALRQATGFGFGGGRALFFFGGTAFVLAPERFAYLGPRLQRTHQSRALSTASGRQPLRRLAPATAHHLRCSVARGLPASPTCDASAPAMRFRSRQTPPLSLRVRCALAPLLPPSCRAAATAAYALRCLCALAPCVARARPPFPPDGYRFARRCWSWVSIGSTCPVGALDVVAPGHRTTSRPTNPPCDQRRRGLLLAPLAGASRRAYPLRPKGHLPFNDDYRTYGYTRFAIANLPL